MTKRQPRYTDEFRAGVILMLQAAGYPDKPGSLPQVARHVDVPANTIQRWIDKKNNPPPPQLVVERKRELIEDLRKLLNLHIDTAVDTVEHAKHSEVMTGLGILFDKIQLLNDKPTGIVRLQRAIEEGDIDPAVIRERYPGLAAELLDGLPRLLPAGEDDTGEDDHD